MGYVVDYLLMEWTFPDVELKYSNEDGGFARSDKIWTGVP